MIVDATDSIPIEIKSPGEEMELSVKALRQAVENKVILLSRNQFPTRRGDYDTSGWFQCAKRSVGG
jgi:hypothetical protein